MSNLPPPLPNPRGAYAMPTSNCPWCGMVVDADWVDIGIGMQQCGPYHCDSCMASQIGPYDKPRELTPEEKKVGWYAPGAPPGSSANVVAGRIVSHRLAEVVYKNNYPYSATEEGAQAIRESPLSVSLSKRPVTPWAVTCLNGGHGKVCLTQTEYQVQMMRPNAKWVCPICKMPAHWDDDHYEEHCELPLGEEEEYTI